MPTTILEDIRLADGTPAAITIRDGRIAAIGAATPPTPGEERIDGGGALALPGLVEAHAHLDKTLLGMKWYRNEVGPSLVDKIDNERLQRRVLGIDPARQSARQVVLALSKGSTHIRTHVDVDTEIGLSGIEGILATRERFRDEVDMQVVAFPQSGMLVRPGTLELMEAAMRAGADDVGARARISTPSSRSPRNSVPRSTSISTSPANSAASRWSWSSSARRRWACRAAWW